MILHRLCVLAVLAQAAPAARAEAPGDAGPRLRITTYGEAVARRDLGIRDPVPVEGQDTVRTLEGVSVVDQTSRIEARLCRRFGIMFTADGLQPGEAAPVTIRSSHPGLRGPDGRVSTGFSYQSRVTGGAPGYVGFTFDHAWELMPGTWTFQVMYQGKVAAEQRFEVSVPPDGGQSLSGACGSPVS